MNWLNNHLNWAWVIFYILILCISFSLLIYTIALPPPMKTITSTWGYYKQGEPLTPIWTDAQGVRHEGKPIGTGEWIPPTYKEIVDEDARNYRERTILYWWWWPTYIIGTILGCGWVIKHKNRNLAWIWVTFVFPITPLLLKNNKLTTPL